MDVPDDHHSKRVRIVQAYQAYQQDRVQLATRSVAGFTHLVATRKGIFAVNQQEWVLLLKGFFFGMVVRGDEIFAFEACDQPYSITRQGRLIRITLSGSDIVESAVLVKGLDNGCHQIDFIQGRLHVVDTYNQRMLRFAPGEQTYEVIVPLPGPQPDRNDRHDPAHVHMNSVLGVGDRILTLLHNRSTHTGRNSEIALFDEQWREHDRWQLLGKNCHNMVLLPTGALLVCDSDAGRLITTAGQSVAVTEHFLRGLAVNAESVVVGSSKLSERNERMVSDGFVTFLDGDYRAEAVLHLPGSPTEIRRLDGHDFGSSAFLAQQPWGKALAAPKETTPHEVGA